MGRGERHESGRFKRPEIIRERNGWNRQWHQYARCTGAGWTPNQWVGYSAVNLTQTFSSGAGSGKHAGSWIISNTSDTINVKADADIDGPNTNFASGVKFEIHKVLIALDQPGRGKGAMITGDDPG